ncbi:MAG TPA: hypothetical protein VF786_01760 [Terriglobales bacterium]
MANKKYRNGPLLVTLALALVSTGLAQYKRPAPRTQPRGTAVVERLPGGKMRLVPVCIFYENKFYDAQFYQIRTVPMALQGDTLYEVQRAGEPIGLFTVNTAFRSGTRWSAEGKWRSYSLADKRADELREQQRAIAQAKEDKAAPGEFRLPGGGSDRGRGKRNPKDKGGDTSKSGSDKTDKSGSDNDSDRPTLHRKDDSKTAENTPPPDDDPDRPTLKRKEEEKPAATATSAAAEPQPEPTRDEDRPKLRHTTGKEAEQSGADLPSAKPSNAKGSTKGAAVPEATYAAVSDPQPVESHSLALNWRQEEQQEVAQKMATMAQAEIRKALPLRVARIAPKVLPLTDIETRTFDLDMSNNPIVVFTGAYAAPLNGPGGASGSGQHAPYRVTLVARQNAEGQLIKLMSHVSDPTDLDGSPEWRLVDAVDVDGDGRGELLFRKSTASGTGWLVEKVTPYETEAIFDGAAH